MTKSQSIYGILTWLFSCDPIFQRFQTVLPDLTIGEWTDDDFLEQSKIQEYEDYDNLSKERQASHHRYRQTQFIPRCMRYFKRKRDAVEKQVANNSTAPPLPKSQWVTTIDSDEYFQFNGGEGMKNTQFSTKIPPYRNVYEAGSVVKYLTYWTNLI